MENTHNVVEKNVGIFKDAVDYHVYQMSKTEIIVGFFAGALVAAVVLYVFFAIPLLSIIGAVAGGFIGRIVYKNILKQKRDKNLKIQFRDMLESLSTSLGSGKNIREAFEEVYSDMCGQFGEDSYIAKECGMIHTGVAQNVNIEEMLESFGKRSNNEDIESFSDIFEVVNRAGGNMKNVIYETKNMISDKLEIELELETMVSGKKNELNIMIVMPLIVVTQVQSLGTSGSGPVMILAKIAALAIFIAAYALGKFMTNIKV